MPTIGIAYSGAGGLALGAHKAGLEVVWGVDADADCAGTFNRNFGNAVHADIADIRWRSLPDADVLGFGLPFQKIHSEYQRGRMSRPGRLDIYQSIIDAVDALKPRYFLVAMDHALTHFFRRQRHVSTSGTLVKRLGSRMPYQLAHQIVLFHEMGVPQVRTQAFVAGWRNGESPYEFPANLYPTTMPSRVALGGIPADAPNHEIIDDPDDMVKVRRIRGRIEASGERRFFVERDDPMADDHRRIIPDSPSFMMVPGWGFEDVYKHPWENRRLTAREQARLQTFPDWFAFDGGHDAVRRQISHAVPPSGARQLFEPMVDMMRQDDIID